MADLDGQVAASFAVLDAAMRRAVEVSLVAIRAGSLGIGAVVARPDGYVVASGRNRLHEDDVGDDLVAGTSLAHAEINALAKLRFRAHDTDELVLHTTLQPCLQCLGAIRLSPVREVRILAPDPLWIGVERLRSTTSHIGLRWPAIRTLPASEWAVLTLLSPTRHALDHPVIGPPWRAALPATSDLAACVDLAALGESDPVAVAAARWGDLGSCVAEVEQLAVLARAAQG